MRLARQAAEQFATSFPPIFHYLTLIKNNKKIMDYSGVAWTLLHTWRVRSRGCGVERVVPEARLNLLAKELGFVQIRHQMTEL